MIKSQSLNFAFDDSIILAHGEKTVKSMAHREKTVKSNSKLNGQKNMTWKKNI